MPLIIIIGSLLAAAAISIASANRRLIEICSLIAVSCAAASSFYIAWQVAYVGTYELAPIFSVDALGAILMLAIATVGLAAAFFSVGYLRGETNKQVIGFRRVRQYFVLFDLFLLAMFFAVATVNPIVMWVAIEATTLSTAFLISFYNKPTAMEAAWKYLIINSIGLLLALFGTLLFFTALGVESMSELVNWKILLANAHKLDPIVAKIAFVFVFIGYGTKTGLVPMHTWLPDAHSKAPAPISALLSGLLLNVSFLAILRFKVITDTVVGGQFSQTLMILFGVLSIVLAGFIILGQRNYKRLMAYSSLENMGIISLGFGLGGAGIFAALLHMIYHAIAKSALFLSAGNIFLKYSVTRILKVRGLLHTMPITGVVFILGFIAITAVPPSGMFLTELAILTAGIVVHPIITAVALFGLVIAFIGFLRHVSWMVFGNASEEIQAGENNYWIVIPPLALICILAYLSLYLPAFLRILLDDAAAIF